MVFTILLWYLGSSLIGWMVIPLTSKIFHYLPTKGYAFSRILGLLIWGYFFWLAVSLKILSNDHLSQSIILCILLGASIYFGLRKGFKQKWHWVISHWKLILGIELVFIISFLAFTIFRGFSPDIVGTEKPMEFAFLNAVLRSEGFPPYDPWLSGYTISYYYFGYVLVAMITRLTGTASAIAFNLSQSLWFAMIASSAYGLTVDLFAVWSEKHRDKKRKIQSWMLRWAAIAPILILLLGNAYGFFETLNARGLFWTHSNDAVYESQFWGWMDLRGLTDPPSQPFQWQPQTSGTVSWWNASRVLQDRDLAGETIEIIDEFPNFSFVLGDLHPHVLAMPFVLLAIGLIFEVFISVRSEPWQLWKIKLPIHPGRFILFSGLIGSLAFLNTWDWPIYAALFAAVVTLKTVVEQGWNIRHLFEFLAFGLAIGFVGFVFFLPFFQRFSSQAAGILPSMVFITRGGQFWVMLGILLIPISGYLAWCLTRSFSYKGMKRALLFSAGLIILLLILNVAMSLVAVRLEGLGDLFTTNLGASGINGGDLLWETLKTRLMHPGTSLLLIAMLVISLISLFAQPENRGKKLDAVHSFLILLILWGALLTLVPEYVYLLDNFGTRMNTIFKFYFQTWVLWSLAGAFIIGRIFRRRADDRFGWPRILIYQAVLITVLVLVLTIFVPAPAIETEGNTGFGFYWLDWLWGVWGIYLLFILIYSISQRRRDIILRVVIIYLLGIGLFYPLRAIPTRADGFKDFSQWTLDGSAYYQQRDPALMLAVETLFGDGNAVIVEAVGSDGGDYSSYARVSMLSGMPTVLGWQYHEVQWRGGDEEIGTRPSDIALLYETHDWESAKAVIDQYNIEYIYIGDLERATYHLEEEKLRQNMELYFTQGNVTIYHLNID